MAEDTSPVDDSTATELSKSEDLLDQRWMF